MRIALMMALLAAACQTSVASRPPPPDPNFVHIGMLVPLSGPTAVTNIFNTPANVALQEINALGGVNGKKLDVILRDSREGLPEANMALIDGVNELADAGAVIIIGPGLSSSVLTIKDTVVARKIVLNAFSATSPAITTLDDMDYIYRLVTSDALQGAVLTDLLRKDGIDNVAVIHRDDVYGNGLAGTLRSNFEMAGGRIVSDVPYPADKTADFGPEVSMLFANGPPAAIAVIGFSLDSAAILVALAALNPNPLPKLYGVDGNATLVFVANAPPSVVIGMRGTGSAPGPPQNGVFAEYADTYRRVVGQEPVLGAEAIYDAVYMTALALLQGRENTKEAVYQNLREISRPDSPNPILIPGGPAGYRTALQNVGADLDYVGTRGAMNYDAAGDLTSGIYGLWEVVQGPMGPTIAERGQVTAP